MHTKLFGQIGGIYQDEFEEYLKFFSGTWNSQMLNKFWYVKGMKYVYLFMNVKIKRFFSRLRSDTS